MPNHTKELPLSGHLDELRTIIMKCAIAWIATALVCFLGKNVLFKIIFAPAQGNFIIFRALRYLSQLLNMPSLAPEEFTPHFIATELTAQFMTHITVSLLASVVICLPFMLYQLFQFVAPALQQNSKRSSAKIIIGSFYKLKC